jgi:hypothetical protein
VGSEQREKQMVRKTPNLYRLTVIVANELAGTDERFCDPFDRAPTRLVLKPVNGYLFGFVPSGGKRRICLPEFVNPSSAAASNRSSGCHAASVGEGLQKASLPLFG